jgi:lipopolysaccharide exporter
MTRRAISLPLLDNAAAPPEDSSETATLGKRVRTGSVWNVASNVLLRVSNIFILALVARMVAPEELGVFALATALGPVAASAR